MLLPFFAEAREYTAAEIDQRYEISLPGRSNNQIFIRSIEWLMGSSDPLAAKRLYRDSGAYKLMMLYETEMDLGASHGTVLATTIDITIQDEKVKFAFLGARTRGMGLLFPNTASRINTADELKAFEKLTAKLANGYRDYIMSQPIEPQFERKRSVLSDIEIEGTAR